MHSKAQSNYQFFWSGTVRPTCSLEWLYPSKKYRTCQEWAPQSASGRCYFKLNNDVNDSKPAVGWFCGPHRLHVVSTQKQCHYESLELGVASECDLTHNPTKNPDWGLKTRHVAVRCRQKHSQRINSQAYYVELGWDSAAHVDLSLLGWIDRSKTSLGLLEQTERRLCGVNLLCRFAS